MAENKVARYVILSPTADTPEELRKWYVARVIEDHARYDVVADCDREAWARIVLHCLTAASERFAGYERDLQAASARRATHHG